MNKYIYQVPERLHKFSNQTFVIHAMAFERLDAF